MEIFPKELVGKTIVGIDDTYDSIVKLKMSDGSTFEIVAELEEEFGITDGPYLIFYKNNQ